MPAIAAFPGAEGFGATAEGGRGGKVIEVTTLADSGPGSLRAAIDASAPRTIVFRVGGIIPLGSPLLVRNPHITIAGQTAPGGGILVKGQTRILTQDVIIRHIRFHNATLGTGGTGQSCLGLGDRTQRVIIDHCDLFWNLDDNGPWRPSGSIAPDLQDVTFQRCIFAESLWGHSTGLLIGGGGEEYLKVHGISVHHCLFAHNADRNPRVLSSGAQFVNNVVYNWGSRVGVSVAKNTFDLINNYFKPGPMTNPSMVFKHEAKTPGGVAYPDPSLYVAGNIVKGSFENPSADNWALFQQDPAVGLSGPLPLTYRRLAPMDPGPVPIIIQSAIDAYVSVLLDVGANARLNSQGQWIANSDVANLRVLLDVSNGTGPAQPVASPEAVGGFPFIAPGAPYADSDHDGIPDVYEIAHHLNPIIPGDAQTVRSDGYTNLEWFLNGVN